MQKINILVWTLDVTITAQLARGSPRDFYQLLKSIQIIPKIKKKISIAKSPFTLPCIFLVLFSVAEPKLKFEGGSGPP